MDLINEEVEKESELITPLYRSILEPVMPGDFFPIPKFNYNAYNVFVLRSRLRVLLRQQWGPGINIIFSSTEYNGAMYLKANLFRGKTNINPNKAERDDFKKMLEDAMEEDLDFAVVISNNDLSYHGKIIPSFWIKSILNFIKLKPRDINIKYRVGKYGLEANTYGFEYPSHEQQYGDLDNRYMETYLDIQTEISEVLWRYYKKGYIVNPSINIVLNWELIKVDEVENLTLYKPNSIDRRIVDPYEGIVPFLYSRILGNKQINIYIGMEFIIRDNIARKLHNKVKFIFSGSYFQFEAENINLANKILGEIVPLLTSKGTAIAFRIKSEHITSFMNSASLMGYEGIIYELSSINGNIIMFSISIEPKNIYLSNSYITKLKYDAKKEYLSLISNKI